MKKKKNEIECENLELEIRTIFPTEIMVKAIRNDDLERYKNFFLINKMMKVLNNTDMIYSLKQYLINDLNIAKTSINSFLHRNTLIYRVNKMARVSGLNVRKFSDATLLLNILFMRQFLEELKEEELKEEELKKLEAENLATDVVNDVKTEENLQSTENNA